MGWAETLSAEIAKAVLGAMMPARSGWEKRRIEEHQRIDVPTQEAAIGGGGCCGVVVVEDLMVGGVERSKRMADWWTSDFAAVWHRCLANEAERIIFEVV